MNPNYREGLDFFVIDIESANLSPTSICQFAITEIKNGLLHKITHSYVDPETTDFKFTNYHGITPEMVKGKQPLKKFWKLIKQLEGKYVASHNMEVEFNALRLYAKTHNLEMPEMKMMDTITLNNLLGIDSKELKALANYYSIDLFPHDAISESKAIAISILKYGKAKNVNDPYILYGSLGTIPHEIDDPEKLHKYGIDAGAKKQKEKVVEASPSTPDVSSPTLKSTSDIPVDLKGKLFTFTGELAKFERKEGVKKVKSNGGVFKDNVTMKTDYVVVGDNMDHKTAVLLTAEKYRDEKGLPIQVIGEDEFLKMVGE